MGETDYSTSSTASELKRERKSRKKLDKKSKKYKKEKKKKHNKKEKLLCKKTLSSEKKVEVNKICSQFETEANTSNRDSFGPALPPNFHRKTNRVEKSKDQLIGPAIPKDIVEITKRCDLENKNECSDEVKDTVNLESDGDDDMQDCYGPLPVANEHNMTPAQIQLEHRALKLKMDAIQGTSTSVTEKNVREDWMLELPDVGLKGGLSALNNLKRGFYQGKEKPDFTDRSSWTKTPQAANKEQSLTSSKEVLKQQAQALYEKQRDAEQEAVAKKHKRQKSLLEIHQKKIRKEERKAAKELQDSGIKPERRPFTRDIDLKLNKIDRNQTKQIVSKAKILHTKFSTGQTKYL